VLSRGNGHAKSPLSNPNQQAVCSSLVWGQQLTSRLHKSNWKRRLSLRGRVATPCLYYLLALDLVYSSNVMQVALASFGGLFGAVM
jgi:hypothetical protein